MKVLLPARSQALVTFIASDEVLTDEWLAHAQALCEQRRLTDLKNAFWGVRCLLRSFADCPDRNERVNGSRTMAHLRRLVIQAQQEGRLR